MSDKIQRADDSVPQPADSSTQNKKQTDEEIARRVAERVWEMWQEELRRDRERRGNRL